MMNERIKVLSSHNGFIFLIDLNGGWCKYNAIAKYMLLW